MMIMQRCATVDHRDRGPPVTVTVTMMTTVTANIMIPATLTVTRTVPPPSAGPQCRGPVTDGGQRRRGRRRPGPSVAGELAGPDSSYGWPTGRSVTSIRATSGGYPSNRSLRICRPGTKRYQYPGGATGPECQPGPHLAGRTAPLFPVCGQKNSSKLPLSNAEHTNFSRRRRIGRISRWQSSKIYIFR